MARATSTDRPRCFSTLAQTRRGEEAAHYRLRAAEALREAGDLAGAARAMDGIRHRHLAAMKRCAWICSMPRSR